jgi:hypothetical protein
VYGERIGVWGENGCMGREEVYGERIGVWGENRCLGRE